MLEFKIASIDALSDSIKIGKVSLTFKGPYDNDATYERLDVVYINGASYVLMGDSSTGVSPEYSDDWQCIAGVPKNVYTLTDNSDVTSTIKLKAADFGTYDYLLDQSYSVQDNELHIVMKIGDKSYERIDWYDQGAMWTKGCLSPYWFPNINFADQKYLEFDAQNHGIHHRISFNGATDMHDFGDGTAVNCTLSESGSIADKTFKVTGTEVGGSRTYQLSTAAYDLVEGAEYTDTIDHSGKFV